MSKLVDLNLAPDRKTLRGFGFAALVFFGLFGALILWKKAIVGIPLGEAARPTAYGFWAAGVISALFSLVRPEWNRLLYVGLTLIAFPIGFVLSYVIMGVIYYVIFTPIGLFFRLVGRDSLTRRFDAKAKSYWVDLDEPGDAKSYFRQY